ncbi:NAD(P)H-dependent oxidoreductase [Paenibacillus sp. LHD-117]|uniref:NAD(P)H-dependent oxidoreductase n=1 Tax=Paenibacillus sp. LHD-117 TaxID=3071412 RepID=UPI0027E061DC|nr:NAD(P)H-dependent oxidoreductase [Paenibacillus sp. LHD-117]MDQ6420243.1 NAD(P)H-dependent oxidoreductase [Paenibacillus sp. LHD-117]
MKKEEILEAYRYRHATKEFDPARQISREDIGFILETARLSPTSFGFEPVNLLMVQNKDLRRKLLPVTWGAQKQLPTASHFVILLARTKSGMTAQSEHIQTMMTEVQKLPPDIAENKGNLYHKFLESDFGLLDNERAMFEWASRQGYIALGNMMTAAAQIGIDSCPIEGFDKARVEAILEEEGYLRSEQFGVSCMVAFGYRVREPREKTRRPLHQIVEWIE